MLKILAIFFGILMLGVGILGFYPEFAPNGMLLGIFHVNDIHNAIHMSTGVIAILCGIAGRYPARIFFKIFGIVYGIIAILGFFYLNQPLFGIIANNLADALLHTGIALLSLWLGFCGCCYGKCSASKKDSELNENKKNPE